MHHAGQFQMARTSPKLVHSGRDMSEPKAIRSGFRAVFAHPLALLAEIACHWTAFIGVAVVTLYALFSFLHSLPVSDEDAFLLSGLLPGLTGEALGHIFKGSGPKLLELSVIVAISAAVLRWFATSAGRSAVLPEVLGESVPAEVEDM